MIIWGSKNRELKDGSGKFFCPKCRRETSYTSKLLGEYFTLYFIPVFQTKKLGNFVECNECKTQFKPDVLDNEYVDPQFESVYQMIEAHMSSMTAVFEESISKLSPEQADKFLAFELGVIEFFDRRLLRMGVDDEGAADIRFFNFLIFYGKKKYGESSQGTFNYWHDLAMNGLLRKERELGFSSANYPSNPGAPHFPFLYLKDAVGIDA